MRNQHYAHLKIALALTNIRCLVTLIRQNPFFNLHIHGLIALFRLCLAVCLYLKITLNAFAVIELSLNGRTFDFTANSSTRFIFQFGENHIWIVKIDRPPWHQLQNYETIFNKISWITNNSVIATSTICSKLLKIPFRRRKKKKD